jgi:hypothetical protein
MAAQDYEQVTYNSPSGAMIGQSATEKIAFYGVTPVVQRPYSSAVHASSAASVSSSFGATQLAILQEIQKTLIGLGIWATV